jgi:hypothetical protein
VSLSKGLLLYLIPGTGTAKLHRSTEEIASLIIIDHDLKSVSDKTMDRHQMKTTDPRAVRELSLFDRDWEKSVDILSVDALSAAPIMFGPSSRAQRDFKTSTMHSMDQGVLRGSDHLQDRLDAVRRRLWILSATLEFLPAKFDLACRKSGVFAGENGLDMPQHTHDDSDHNRSTQKAQGPLGGWWAKWKLARLRSRAERVERRAAVAIHDASATFSAALEAVLHAAVARVKADEACLGLYRASSPLRSDRTSPDAADTM